MKRSDIIAVGSIYTLLIVLAMYFYDSYQHTKQLNRLTYVTLQTQHIALQAIEEQKQTTLQLNKMEFLLEDTYNEMLFYQKLSGIKETLKDYSTEEVALGLALAWTESSWNYDIDHNSQAEGICGVVPEFWETYLSEKGIEINSVAACIEIYNYYKETQTQKQAIKKYKGIEKQKYNYLVPYTIKLKHLILKRLQE